MPVNNESKLPRSEQMDACLNKGTGWFGAWFAGKKQATATLPCRYIGIWSSSKRGIANRVTLQADGKYLFEEGGISGGGRRPIVGHWEIQGDSMVWHHVGMEDHPDVNKILKQTETSFTLVEENGSHTEFELIKAIQTDSCAR